MLFRYHLRTSSTSTTNLFLSKIRHFRYSFGPIRCKVLLQIEYNIFLCKIRDIRVSLNFYTLPPVSNIVLKRTLFSWQKNEVNVICYDGSSCHNSR